MSYRSPPAELSNNPFLDHPSNALSRFPNLDPPDDYSGQTARYTSWLSPSGTSSAPSSTPNQYQGQNGYAQPSGYSGGYQQSQQAGYGWGSSPAGGGGYAQSQQGYGVQQPQMTGSGRPFQPSSSFGQQLASQITGAYGGGGGMPQQQQQQQQQMQYAGYQQPTSPTSYSQGYSNGYNAYAPQQQQPQPVQYLSEFDPYASGSAPGQVVSGPAATYAQQHPREYVQQHKTELEVWDSYAWKQVSSFSDPFSFP